MRKLRIPLLKLLSGVCVALFIWMTAIGTLQVVSRHMQRPSAWTEEVLTYSFAWMALLAAALVAGKREHMRLTFLIDKLGEKQRKTAEILVELIFAAFSLLIFVYGGYEICKLTMTQVTPVLQLHMGKVYAVMPVAGLLMLFFCACNILDIKEGKFEGAGQKEAAR